MLLEKSGRISFLAVSVLFPCSSARFNLVYHKKSKRKSERTNEFNVVSKNTLQAKKLHFKNGNIAFLLEWTGLNASSGANTDLQTS